MPAKRPSLPPLHKLLCPDPDLRSNKEISTARPHRQAPSFPPRHSSASTASSPSYASCSPCLSSTRLHSRRPRRLSGLRFCLPGHMSSRLRLHRLTMPHLHHRHRMLSMCLTRRDCKMCKPSPGTTRPSLRSDLPPTSQIPSLMHCSLRGKMVRSKCGTSARDPLHCAVSISCVSLRNARLKLNARSRCLVLNSDCVYRWKGVGTALLRCVRRRADNCGRHGIARR